MNMFNCFKKLFNCFVKPEEEQRAINLEEIRDTINNTKHFNISLLQEALRQAELKINDEHNRKIRIDDRTHSLLTVCLAIIGILTGSVNADYLKTNNYIFLLVNIAGILTVFAAFFLFQTFKSKPYGSIGTCPSQFLSKEYITDYDGANSKNTYIIGIATVRVLDDLKANIKASDESNSERLTLLDCALSFCQLTLIPFLLIFGINFIQIFAKF
ncbi:MAG: hypothetical protein EKK61_00895 [Rickettsiales bacterium]|nr:MAG: hypothetical protein EKK61_00895 [Rickettsiales bacterium]